MTDSTITVADVLFCLPAIEAKAKRCGKNIRHPGDDRSCPIEALAHAIRLSARNMLWPQAAHGLGIPYDVALEVVTAADSPTHPLRAELEAYLSW